MKIMLDANIIVSAILFPKSSITKALKHMIANYKLVLSQYTVDEIREVFNKKFPHRLDDMKNFMEKLPYELYLLKEINNKYPPIRDVDDLPVLANAIESNVDILITGDKDFDEIIIKRPKIIKPGEYIIKYMDKSGQNGSQRQEKL